MMAIPDHPIIRNCERTGYPDFRDAEWPICPECGNECSNVYSTREGTIVGCDVCLVMGDAWEEPQCFSDGYLD